MSDLVLGRHATGERALSITDGGNSSANTQTITPVKDVFSPLSDSEDEAVSCFIFMSKLSSHVHSSQNGNDHRSSSSPPIPATPAPQQGHKRAASASPQDSTSHKRRRSKPSGPAAVLDVAGAIRDLAESFNSPGPSAMSQIPPTPVRLAKAVQKAMKDSALTPKERGILVHHLSQNKSIADAYNACTDEETCKEFVEFTLSRHI